MRGFSQVFSVIVLVSLGMYLLSFSVGWITMDQAGNFLEALEREKMASGMKRVFHFMHQVLYLNRVI